MIFEVSLEEITLLQSYQWHFADWGIIYDLPTQTSKRNYIAGNSSTASSVVVLSVPQLIQERCKQEPKLLIRLIRTELWNVHESRRLPTASLANTSPPKNWLERVHTCPQGIIDMLNSRACRSAIMFNDILTRAQCQLLVRKLADCKFPFQCAHGRPSLVPLVDLAHVAQFSYDDGASRVGGEPFASRFMSWKQNLKS